ncbi:ankyrin repeat domain protein [Nitzschia inconspicua]|uniref:Ankyrin repeat domain protein n=1 Tax=Nitzschia inconspicua TaxID=303405 RepID=A0A9K3L4D1_9STRA|nr:ankyrin repeat domain protein [Nitzschia inconspicua]
MSTALSSRSSERSSNCPPVINQEPSPLQQQRNNNIVTADVSERLFRCATDGNLEALQQERQELILQSRRDDGTTLLHYAAGNGHLEICRFLLQLEQRAEQGQELQSTSQTALLYCTSYKSQRTALHWAARNGQLSVMKFLVQTMTQQKKEKQEDDDGSGDACNNDSSHLSLVDVMAKGQVTPLQLCIWQGHVDCCRFLIEECAANPHLENGWGCTLAHWLAKSPIYQAHLTEDIEHKSSASDSATAAWTRIWTLCRYLDTQLQLDWTLPNRQGQTPLHKAAFAGNLPLCTYLIQTKPHLLDDTRDQQHLLAADCAERGRQFETAEWLRLHASPVLWKHAYQVLFHHDSKSDDNTLSYKRPCHAPTVTVIRQIYKRLITQYHPDRQVHRIQLQCRFQEIRRQNNQQPTSDAKWNEIQDAYNLWMAYWNDPTNAARIIRQRSRHCHLQDIPPLLQWHAQWHIDFEHQKTVVRSKLYNDHSSHRHTTATTQLTSHEKQSNKKKAQAPIAPQSWQDLATFQTNLSRLLQTLPHQCIPLSRLPKEYHKTYQHPGASFLLLTELQQAFHCKQLKYFLETHCGDNFHIVWHHGTCTKDNVASIEKPAIPWVQLRTGKHADESMVASDKIENDSVAVGSKQTITASIS